jgi:putative oxidoreductase
MWADMRTRPAWGIMLLRVVLGSIYVMHGYYAAGVLGIDRTTELIARLGNPEPLSRLLAWYVLAAHLAGGALLVLGLFTMAAALAQLPIMAAAVFLLHWPQGFFMRGIIVDAAAGRAVAGGYEFALLVLAATLSIVFTGPGALALDRTRDRHRERVAMP